MVVQAIQMKCSLDNVDEIRIPENHEFVVDLQQSGGTDTKEGVLLCREDKADLVGSKGEANLILPSWGNASISFVEKTDKRVNDADCEGTYEAEHSEKWKTMWVVECRNCEIIKWHLTGGYKVLSSDRDGECERKEFKDVNLNADFCDVDDHPDSPGPVNIMEIETQVVTHKK